MSSIQRDRKAENNQGNNQIVNITLGEKITKETKQEAIPVALPVDDDDDENDELVKDLEEIIIKFDEIKDDIIAMGIPIPKRLSKIPDDISEINTLEDIKNLIREIKSRIKELQNIKLRPKRETPQQAAQPTFYQPPPMPTAYPHQNLFRQFVPQMPTGTAQMFHRAPPSRPGEERPIDPVIPPSRTDTGGPSQKCPTYDDVVDAEREEIIAKLNSIKTNPQHSTGERRRLLNDLITQMVNSRARFVIQARCDKMRQRWAAMEDQVYDFSRALNSLMAREEEKPPPDYTPPESTPPPEPEQPPPGQTPEPPSGTTQEPEQWAEGGRRPDLEPEPEPEPAPDPRDPAADEGETGIWDPSTGEWVYPSVSGRTNRDIITDYINKLNEWSNDIVDRTYGDEYYRALLQEKLNMLQTALDGSETEQENAINDAILKSIFLNSKYPAANALKYIFDSPEPVKSRTLPSEIYDKTNNRIIYENINELSLPKVRIVIPGTNTSAEVYRLSINKQTLTAPNFGPIGSVFNPRADSAPTSQVAPGSVSPDPSQIQYQTGGEITQFPSSFGYRGRAEEMAGTGASIVGSLFSTVREGMAQAEQQRTGERLPPAIGDLPRTGTPVNPYGRGLTQP
jgi:hypothetical protein